MQEKIEKLIKFIYKRWKSGFSLEPQAHPDEETLAGFSEAKLSKEEEGRVKLHLLHCDNCAAAVKWQLDLIESQEKEVPEALLAAVKNLVSNEANTPILEIFLKVKAEILELINTTGDVLVDQELVPAPVLRSRKIKDFKDEILILKDFQDIRVEIKIENKGAHLFDVTVIAKEKQTLKVIKDLRVTLVKDGIELGSYLNDSGKVTFEHVIFGKYTIEVAKIENKLASIILEIKA